VTPRENFRILVDGGTPRWIPFTLDVGASAGFTDAIQARFVCETGASDPAEHFDYDLRTVSLERRRGDGGACAPGAADLPPGTTFDEWGIGHWAGGASDTYERMFPPLAGELDAARIRDLAEPVIEPGDTAARVAAFQARGYPVAGYAGSIYEWSWWLRGMEQFLVDLLERPDLAEALVAKVAGFTTRLALASARAGIDQLCFYDDAGSQAGMQISPPLWRSLIKPAWKSVLDAVRREHPEARFFLHSCGDITPVVADVAEIGFHVLHPVQPECMDALLLKKRFGDRIVLCATLGAQRTLARGTPAEVAAETGRLIDTLGADRRCLVCPSNRIQPETPWENVLAFERAAREHCGCRGQGGEETGADRLGRR
jgi:uroporphyrinogen decarboxylase